MTVLCIPAACSAQSLFDGTWRINLDQSTISPRLVVFSVSGAMYECSSCNPRIDVPADGRDESVNGQSFDTMNVRVTGPNSIRIATKKDSKTMAEQTRSVSDDGDTLTVETTFHPADSEQASGDLGSYVCKGRSGTSWRERNVRLMANRQDQGE